MPTDVLAEMMAVIETLTQKLVPELWCIAVIDLIMFWEGLWTSGKAIKFKIQ